MDAMSRLWFGAIALASSLLVPVGARAAPGFWPFATSRLAPVPVAAPADLTTASYPGTGQVLPMAQVVPLPENAQQVGSAPEAGPAAQGPGPAGAEGGELQRLLVRMTALSEYIARNSQAADIWRTYAEQADVLLQIAGYSDSRERDGLLRMAVDSYYAAAVQSPASEPSAYQKLAQLPDQLARSFANNPVVVYAMRQEIQADYARQTATAGDKPEKAREYYCQRLMQFARQNGTVPEAAQAVFEAGQTLEGLGKKEQAQQCYSYLTQQFPTHALARKAQGALWRWDRLANRSSWTCPCSFRWRIGLIRCSTPGSCWAS